MDETTEMHESFDQALRSAMQGLGSMRDRKARSEQMKADQARVAAAADRHQFEAYQQAQDAMLRGQLGEVTSSEWWDKASPEQLVQTRELAERYADVSPYAQASLDNLMTEAAHRGVDLDSPTVHDTPTAEPTRAAVIEPASTHSADRIEGETPERNTPPDAPSDGPGETPGYERARASDMPDATPKQVQTRLNVAASFPHPIRVFLDRNTKASTGQASAPSRRQQLRRGK